MDLPHFRRPAIADCLSPPPEVGNCEVKHRICPTFAGQLPKRRVEPHKKRRCRNLMQQHLQVCFLTAYERLFDDVINLVFDLVVDVGFVQRALGHILRLIL